jgi:four helix bundle protein
VLVGRVRAWRTGVGARTFRELEAWQFADSLRRHVIDITTTGRAAKDFRYVDQIRRAVNSACANIAEGFGRYHHKEFAQFLSIAKGSLTEVQDHLAAGAAMGYWTPATAANLDAEARAAIALVTALITHLRRTKAP